MVYGIGLCTDIVLSYRHFLKKDTFYHIRVTKLSQLKLGVLYKTQQNGEQELGKAREIELLKTMTGKIGRNGDRKEGCGIDCRTR